MSLPNLLQLEVAELEPIVKKLGFVLVQKLHRNVYSGTMKGKDCVLKLLDKTSVENNDRDCHVAAVEITLLKALLKLQKIHSVSYAQMFEAAWEAADCFVLITRFAGRTLRDYLNETKLTDKNKKILLQSLLDGLRFLHDTAGIAHHDIKPDNITVEVADGVPTCRYIDFGGSIRREPLRPKILCR